MNGKDWAEKENIRVVPVRVTNHSTFINYAYVVINRLLNACVIIDPAWEADKIEEALSPEQPKVCSVLLTHSHFDHTNLVDYFAGKYQCGVWMSEPEVVNYHYQNANLRVFKNHRTIHSAGLYITPIVTPGHTRGSTCYLIGDNLFTGDTLFIEGCGICTGAGADPYEMYASLTYLRNSIGKNVLIFPGHTYVAPPGQSFAYTLDNNIYLHFNDPEKFAGFRMRKGQKGTFSFK